MFWKKKPKTSPQQQMRTTLFGDVPFESWVPSDANEEPWSSFSRALRFKKEGDTERAKAALQSIIEQEGLEPRHYLQAYHFLRAMGQKETGQVWIYGVVIEVGIDKNTFDLLVIYSDLSARYLGAGGSIVVWDRPNPSLDKEVLNIFEMGVEFIQHANLHSEERPDELPKGKVRISLLTSQGIHYGQGMMSIMANDPRAAGIYDAGSILMRKLAEKAQ